MTNEEMLTAKKVAEKLGVPPKKVSDFIRSNGIEPDQKKGPCCYYGAATVKKIEKGLK
jgi:hypothetical protein